MGAYGLWVIWAADMLLETAMVVVAIIGTIAMIFGNRKHYGASHDGYDN